MWSILPQKFLEQKSIVKIDRVAPFKGRAEDVDVVQDLMIHDIDLLIYLFKEVPISVSASGFKIKTSKWDHVTATFKFASNRIAFLTVSRNYVVEKRDVNFMTSDGCLNIDLLNRKMLIAQKSLDEISEVNYEARDHLLEEQKSFYESILNQAPISVSIEDGYRAMKILEKVLESLDIQKEVLI